MYIQRRAGSLFGTPTAGEKQWLWQQRQQERQRMLLSKHFLLNHGDPQSKLDGLRWPSGFIQLPAPTKNFKPGCITMHVNARGVVFRSYLLMSHEDGNLVWGPFWRNLTSKKERKYGYINHAYRCDKLELRPIILIFFFNKVQNILTSLTWKVLIAMLFDILVLLMFADEEKREEQCSSWKGDSCRNRQCNGRAVEGCQCKCQQSSQKPDTRMYRNTRR